MKKKGNIFVLGCAIIYLLISLIACPVDPIIYTVTFDSQLATIAANPISKTVTSPATMIDELPTAPEKTGYTFGGWYTSVSGGGTAFTSSTVVTRNLTVYAKWNVTYTVTFDSQGATTVANPTSKTVISPATTIGVLPTAPEKTGYTFGGWYTAEEGGGTAFTAETLVTEDITVYAKWNSYSYAVSFDSQGATTVANPTSKTVTSPDTTIDELPTDPIKTGYTFGGWYTAVNGGGSEFTSSTIVTEDIPVYAKLVQLKVGDLGQAGGYVFYDKGIYSDGWRYLEAAPVSNEWAEKVWGGYSTYVGGTSTAIGAGASNTEKIVSAFGDSEPYENKSDYAAKLCAELVVTKDGVVYNDWFLPSKDELNLMYVHLKSENLGSFSDEYYWSSSEYFANYAWYQYFSSGYQGLNTRCSSSRVRPVRAF